MSTPTIDARGNHHAPEGTGGGKFQVKPLGEAKYARATPGQADRNRARLAGLGTLAEKIRDQEAAILIGVAAAQARAEHPEVATLAFIGNQHNGSFIVVDVLDEGGNHLGSYAPSDLYDDYEPGFTPAFNMGNVQGCFDDEDKTPHEVYPSFTANIAACESVDPDDAGSLTPHLLKAVASFEEHDADRFIDRVRSIETPADAASLRLTAVNDVVVGADWVNEKEDIVGELDQDLLENAVSLSPEGLATIYSRQQDGFDNEFDDFNNRDYFFIDLNAARPAQM